MPGDAPRQPRPLRASRSARDAWRALVHTFAKGIPGAAKDLFTTRAGLIALTRALAASLALACVVLRYGWPEFSRPGFALAVQIIAVLAFWVLLHQKGRWTPDLTAVPKSFRALTALATGKNDAPPTSPRRTLELILALLLTIAGLLALFMADFALLLLDVVAITAFSAEAANYGGALLRRMPTALGLPASFALLILICTLLLQVPAATPEGIPFVDALFTATSAVCVTGLTVRDTATGFTSTGHGIIATFIQLGGFGIVLFGAGLAVILRSLVSLKDHVALRDMLDRKSIHDLKRFIFFVLAATFLLELLGAILLYPAWSPPPGQELTSARRWGLSFFHSISAFCNAGFDITGASLVPLRGSPLALPVLMTLIILGGLGFPVLMDLFARGVRIFRHGRRRARLPQLTLHTRLTLAATAILLILGFLCMLLAQYLWTPLGSAPFGRHFSDCAFMSVSARTAGFNVLPMDEIAPGSRITLMGLMLVGGSPGSMAGGMKTTTLAVLALAVIATLRGRMETEAGGRALPEAIVRKAGAIALTFIAIPLAATFCLALTDPGDLSILAFEAISAATTTGLSLGITPALSDGGKLVLIVTMFLGRVGPLALMGALVFHKPRSRSYVYPRESVSLG